MILGVDASNIRGGGGVTHLVELLRAAQPDEYGFDQVIVWAGRSTLSRLDDQPWLRKAHVSVLDRGPLWRLYWQRFVLDRVARSMGCTILFVPGGSYMGSFRPFVTMSQNMLPFESSEIARYGASLVSLRLRMLKHVQSRTFARADGLIFLSRYAHDAVIRTLRKPPRSLAIIPHGVSERFLLAPREQEAVSSHSFDNPLRCLYVSSVTLYKHQWKVVEAVGSLRKEGYPVVLDLVGPATATKGLRLLRRAMEHADPTGEFIFYHGSVTYENMARYYREADLFIFASSCENMPNILLEAMASGLPIACSECGPMPEVLGDHGTYFHPEDPRAIVQAMRVVLDDPSLRTANAVAAFDRAGAFTWSRCARETFSFLSEIMAGEHAENT